jgi:hypothetical protein
VLRSPWGTFVTVLVLTTYINLSSDRLPRRRSGRRVDPQGRDPGEKGLFERVRSAFG